MLKQCKKVATIVNRINNVKLMYEWIHSMTASVGQRFLIHKHEFGNIVARYKLEHFLPILVCAREAVLTVECFSFSSLFFSSLLFSFLFCFSFLFSPFSLLCFWSTVLFFSFLPFSLLLLIFLLLFSFHVFTSLRFTSPLATVLVFFSLCPFRLLVVFFFSHLFLSSLFTIKVH